MIEGKPDIHMIVSKDGSHTLELPGLNETYHSRHGAITESNYVFIEKGFMARSGNTRILEVGFGTGLNALLTLERSNEDGRVTTYHTIEAYPLDMEIIEKLNYPASAEQKRVFLELHKTSWNKEKEISSWFHLTKLQSRLETVTLENNFYDLVYFDAFAPSKQPEMWIPERLSQVRDSMRPGGLLVTYCAQGQFKRALGQLGFQVETLQGPPGKAEMVRATRKSSG